VSIEIGGTFLDFLGTVSCASLQDSHERAAAFAGAIGRAGVQLTPGPSRETRVSLRPGRPDVSQDDRGPLDGIGLLLLEGDLDPAVFDEETGSFDESAIASAIHLLDGGDHPVEAMFGMHRGATLVTAQEREWMTDWFDYVLGDDDVDWILWSAEQQPVAEWRYHVRWLTGMDDFPDVCRGARPDITQVAALLLAEKLAKRFGRMTPPAIEAAER
jgi:hypothetical protein